MFGVLVLMLHNVLLSHPVLLFGEVHPKLGRSRCEDRPTQKWGGYELNDMWQNLLLWRLAYLCHQFHSVYSFMLLKQINMGHVIMNK